MTEVLDASALFAYLYDEPRSVASQRYWRLRICQASAGPRSCKRRLRPASRLTGCVTTSKRSVWPAHRFFPKTAIAQGSSGHRCGTRDCPLAIESGDAIGIPGRHGRSGLDDARPHGGNQGHSVK